MSDKKKIIENTIGFDLDGNNPRNTNYFRDNQHKSGKNLEQSLLGHASNFFRFNHEYFTNVVIPKFLHEEVIRIWSAACSHGPEPYTINMIMKNKYPNKRVKILGTDVGEIVIECANIGVWQECHLKGMETFYIKEYFEYSPTRANADWGAKKFDNRIGVYKINEVAQKDVKFELANMFDYRPKEKQHIIMCNNVLSYFTKEKQLEALDSLIECVEPNGVLFTHDDYQDNFLGTDYLDSKLTKLTTSIYWKK